VTERRLAACRGGNAGFDVRQVLARGLMHGFLNHSAEIEPISHALDLIAEV
jgi:acetyl esterase